MGAEKVRAFGRPDAVFFDVKGVFRASTKATGGSEMKVLVTGSGRLHRLSHRPNAS